MSVIDKFRLTGKNAIVTGGHQGIGQCIALAFAEAGADVAIIDLNDAPETVKKVRSLGRQCFSVKADIVHEEEVENAFKEIDSRFSSIDILFNNAGICICTPAEEMTLHECGAK